MFIIPTIKLLEKWNVNCDAYISAPNKFHILTAGDSHKCQSYCGYLEVEDKFNLFTHHHKQNETCLLSVICNCIRLLGFEKVATHFYNKKWDVLCQDNPKFWNEILSLLFKYVPQMKLKKLCNPENACWSKFFTLHKLCLALAHIL